MKLPIKVGLTLLSLAVTLIVVLAASAQMVSASDSIVCAEALEHSRVPVATIACPEGMVIESIDFASYGTPGGSCGSYSVGSCDAENSLAAVQSLCLGQHSCSVGANNGVFGDPCAGTEKWLFIQATCGSVGSDCEDGRINTNCSAPEIVYCNGDNAEFYAYNYDISEGEFDFSIPLADLQKSVAVKTLIKHVGAVSVYLMPDGRVLLVAAQPDGKDYFMFWDPSTCSSIQEGAEWHVQ